MVYCDQENLEVFIKGTMPPSKADTLMDIIFLGINGEPVRLPEKQEYPDLFPGDDRGFFPVDEHYKASLARRSKEDLEYLEKHKIITIENLNGSKMICVDYSQIGSLSLVN